ncbi:MAG: hypothetical protein ACI9VR_003485 [Cognaticolwellia sp.]|jgi:hypothetical protein
MPFSILGLGLLARVWLFFPGPGTVQIDDTQEDRMILLLLIPLSCGMWQVRELDPGAVVNLRFLETEQACRMAGGGQACTVDPDDSLGLLPPNSVQFVEGDSWFACARSEAISYRGECACTGPGLEPQVVDCTVFQQALELPESLPVLVESLRPM